MNKPKSKKCDICNKVYTKKSNLANKYWDKQRYCSKKCWYKKMTGEKSPYFKHGRTLINKNEPLYFSWVSMKSRCYDKKGKSYKYYGAKGIKVCKKWMEASTFVDWALKNGWEKGLALDRINSGGNYCPSNCRWITKSENSRRSNKKRWKNYKLKKRGNNGKAI